MANKATFKGKLGSDPELKYTNAGTAVCKISLAVTEKYKDKATGQQKQVTLWVKVVAWANLAQVCAQYLRKGQEALFFGKIVDASWEKDGVKHRDWNLMAQEMEFCGPAPRADDDDIPF